MHEETGKAVTVGIGRYGPYIRLGQVYKKLTADEDLLTMNEARALELVVRKRTHAAPFPAKCMGLRPHEGTGAITDSQPYVCVSHPVPCLCDVRTEDTETHGERRHVSGHKEGLWSRQG